MLCLKMVQVNLIREQLCRIPTRSSIKDKLYVGYSNNGQRHGNNNSAELAVIPIEKLAVE